VVGDPDQCIYSFSGSCAGAVSAFRAAYPSAATVRLAHNFRSDGHIVEAAAALIARQPGREAAAAPVAVRARGGLLCVLECRDGAAEAAMVCDALLQMPRGAPCGAPPAARALLRRGVLRHARCAARALRGC
jgi:superfamily I DNA/RNA helicase